MVLKVINTHAYIDRKPIKVNFTSRKSDKKYFKRSLSSLDLNSRVTSEHQIIWCIFPTFFISNLRNHFAGQARKVFKRIRYCKLDGQSNGWLAQTSLLMAIAQTLCQANMGRSDKTILQSNIGEIEWLFIFLLSCRWLSNTFLSPSVKALHGVIQLAVEAVNHPHTYTLRLEYVAGQRFFSINER